MIYLRQTNRGTSKGNINYESGNARTVKAAIEVKRNQGKIFRAAKHILQKQGYEQLSIKNICEEAGVSNGSSITISRLRMIFCPTISKNSPASILIFWICPKMPRRPRRDHPSVLKLRALLSGIGRRIHVQLLYA